MPKLTDTQIDIVDSARSHWLYEASIFVTYWESKFQPDTLTVDRPTLKAWKAWLKAPTWGPNQDPSEAGIDDLLTMDLQHMQEVTADALKELKGIPGKFLTTWPNTPETDRVLAHIADRLQKARAAV